MSAFSFTLSLGDLIIQQFSQLLSLEVRNEKFLSFKPLEKRLDVFLHPYISQPYPQLCAFIRNLLLLSHGQAMVERGFSINKQAETCNIQKDTVIAQRVVCDYVSAITCPCMGVLPRCPSHQSSCLQSHQQG